MCSFPEKPSRPMTSSVSSVPLSRNWMCRLRGTSPRRWYIGMARSLVDGQRGEQLPHRGRELEAVARAGRADDDPAAALEDEPLVVGRGVEAALRPDRLRVGGGKPA